jgi:hypothetical protein
MPRKDDPNNNRRYRKLRDAGLCVGCGKVAADAGVHCVTCKAKVKANELKPDRVAKKRESCDRHNKRPGRFEFYRQQYLAGGKQRLAARAKEAKRTVIAFYGSKCVCCGESRESMLSVDHVNNDGYIHRKSSKGGFSFYRWLIKHNFQCDRPLQLLCFNCNQSKRINGGVCEHQTERLFASVT